ncbi:putative dual-specificity RNA methyltransferase RlmN [bioreactor metagenome]|uniref:Putative dual-specificity RNA methyltransferase RlmN n=1 Tax=bioreactor metagenome TaxID=1076179 RepID=A0A645ASA3_9ZZZZ|nr:23S rRNA (adenine(2503)-C(2))-methyltransferase RlmN [Oscillospiraceae bacterium]
MINNTDTKPLKKYDIRSMFPEEIQALIVPLGFERYRAEQIFSWLYKGTDSFEDMTNLSRTARTILNDHFYIETPKINTSFKSKEDGTIKLLLEFPDGEFAECVALGYKYGYSACVSSQAGCKMGCSFCASTKAGFTRDLTAGEILVQIEMLQRELRKELPEAKIGHVVMMGIGEPLDNYNNSIKFIRLANDPRGYNIGMRNISLSTCGLVDKINKLAEEDLPITLSVSLHAPNNELRSSLMPVNNKYPIEELIYACREYIRKTGRRISFEYSLIHGVNDTPECAKELSKLLAGMMCHVNVIPVNPISEKSFKGSPKERILLFTNLLSLGKINVTVRRTLGADIDAACGQLRRKRKQN